MSDLLEQAILKVKSKLYPSLGKDPSFVPEPHTQLFSVLQVFGVPDEDIVDKVKYIYDYLAERGNNPKEQVIDIYSNMASISDIPLVDRVYKFCKLKDQADRALRHYKTLEREINAFYSPRRKR